jgi:alpha-ketoglutarate-dependent taurine dioxygenase
MTTYLDPVKPGKYKNFTVVPLTGVIGAEIVGLDLREQLDSSVWEEILQAFADHQVLVFESQELSHVQHENFASGFGKITKLQRLHSVEGHENVQVIRRSAGDTQRVVGENWHSDATWTTNPPKTVVMRAIEVPDFGGDTAFLSTAAAYDALSPAFKKHIESLDVVHSGTRIFGSAYHNQDRRYNPTNVMIEQTVEEGDHEVIHPLVCTNPFNGRKYLYLSKNYSQRFVGFTNAESAPILNYLYEHSARYDFTCRIKWKKNQIVVWDNSTTMHLAVPDYAGKDRMLARVSLEGPKPAR